MTVAVCIPTFRRPDGLRTLLGALNDLEGVEDMGVRVVVIDNDADGSGRKTVDAVGEMKWPLEYCVEPTRGEPFARNLALQRAGSDFVAFIDDDEWPEPRWLAELVQTQRATGADVVFGPVVPRFAAEPPRWLERGRFLAPLDFPADAHLHFAYAGNALLRTAAFPDLRFSERYARLGGVDTHFFMRAHLRGQKIVWSPNARVNETVPAERMRIGWLVRREFRRGNTLSLCLLELEASPRRLLKRVAHAFVRIARGVMFVLMSAVRGRAALVRGLREAAFGAGLLAGLFKYEYKEYP